MKKSIKERIKDNSPPKKAQSPTHYESLIKNRRRSCWFSEPDFSREDEIPPLKTFVSFTLFNALFTVSAYYLARAWVDQERPNQKDHYAFPSGLTFYTAFAISLWTFYLSPSQLKKGAIRFCYYGAAGFSWAALFSIALLSVLSRAHYVGDEVAAVCFVLMIFSSVLNFYCSKSKQNICLNRLTELFAATNLAISNPTNNSIITLILMSVLFTTNLLNHYYSSLQQRTPSLIAPILEAIPLPKCPFSSNYLSKKERLIRSVILLVAIGMGVVNAISLPKDFSIPFTAVSGYHSSVEQALGKQQALLLSSGELNRIRIALAITLSVFSFLACLLQGYFLFYSEANKTFPSRETVTPSTQYSPYDKLFSYDLLKKSLSTIPSASEPPSQSQQETVAEEALSEENNSKSNLIRVVS